MNGAKQAGWLFLVLILLACSGGYFARSIPVIKLDDKTLTSMPDAIVSQLTVQQYGTNGQLTNFLNTPLLKHTPQADQQWLQTPHIIVHQENKAPFDIRSERATSKNGWQQITFSEHVVIHQDEDKNTPESTMKTEELIYLSQEKLAKTDKEVTFLQPGNVVKSKGMKAYLNDKRLLLSQARGTYAPKNG